MKRKYIKDGNPALFSFFTDRTYAKFSPMWKERWTLAEDTEYEDIPGEVLNIQNFTEKVNVVPPEVAEKINPVNTTADVPEQPVANAPVERDRDWYKAFFKSKGVQYAGNSKLETLKKKYDAYIAEQNA